MTPSNAATKTWLYAAGSPYGLRTTSQTMAGLVRMRAPSMNYSLLTPDSPPSFGTFENHPDFGNPDDWSTLSDAGGTYNPFGYGVCWDDSNFWYGLPDSYGRLYKTDKWLTQAGVMQSDEIGLRDSPSVVSSGFLTHLLSFPESNAIAVMVQQMEVGPSSDTWQSGFMYRYDTTTYERYQMQGPLRDSHDDGSGDWDYVVGMHSDREEGMIYSVRASEHWVGGNITSTILEIYGTELNTIEHRNNLLYSVNAYDNGSPSERTIITCPTWDYINGRLLFAEWTYTGSPFDQVKIQSLDVNSEVVTTIDTYTLEVDGQLIEPRCVWTSSLTGAMYELRTTGLATTDGYNNGIWRRDLDGGNAVQIADDSFAFTGSAGIVTLSTCPPEEMPMELNFVLGPGTRAPWEL